MKKGKQNIMEDLSTAVAYPGVTEKHAMIERAGALNEKHARPPLATRGAQATCKPTGHQPSIEPLPVTGGGPPERDLQRERPPDEQNRRCSAAPGEAGESVPVSAS